LVRVFPGQFPDEAANSALPNLGGVMIRSPPVPSNLGLVHRIEQTSIPLALKCATA